MANNLPLDLKFQNYPGLQLANIPELARAIAYRSSTNSHIRTASPIQTQAGATQLFSGLSNCNVAAIAGDALRMPRARAGQEIVILNSSGRALSLFPSVGDTINAALVNASVSVANVTTSKYYCIANGQWWGGATTNET